MPSSAERTWAAILRLNALVLPRLDRAVLHATGLPLTWYDVLLELHDAGGRLTMSELGARVVLSRTRVSRLVDELVGAGLVAKAANPDDGRSSFAAITPEGSKRFREAARVYLPAIEAELARIDDAELSIVADGLERILARARED
ncbi:MarR family transcriptional regulator [Agromyces protaetiae]|uniref:MarR family transcriptional regulator n=1 Tax=Agromyces protaetiae TaxID=2509455 RepID=A0A4P6F9H8_9MICO|nr:MarR family transcriptional regulator [Agromyces protaetiae]QAY72552.1 MarR family transcriptional regulator [Agromyces protaetiae]